MLRMEETPLPIHYTLRISTYWGFSGARFSPIYPRSTGDDAHLEPTYAPLTLRMQWVWGLGVRGLGIRVAKLPWAPVGRYGLFLTLAILRAGENSKDGSFCWLHGDDFCNRPCQARTTRWLSLDSKSSFVQALVMGDYRDYIGIMEKKMDPTI